MNKEKYIKYHRKIQDSINMMIGGKVTKLLILDDDTEINYASLEESGYNNILRYLNKTLNVSFHFAKNIDGASANSLYTKMKIYPYNTRLVDDHVAPSVSSKYATDTADLILIKFSIIDSFITPGKDSCLWLITGPLKENNLYLAYINSMGGCFTNMTNSSEYQSLGIGTLMMELFIEVGRFFKFTSLSLLDNSSKECMYDDVLYPRSFSKASIVSSGMTFYGKFGFMPINLDDQHYASRIHQIFTSPMNLYISHDIITEIKEKINVPIAISSSRPADIVDLMNQYVDGLLENYSTGETLAGYTSKKIKEKCVFEIVCNDLIENYGLLKNCDIDEIKTKAYNNMIKNLTDSK